MSAYINIHSLGFPFHEGDIRLLHPEIREDQTGDTFPCPPEFEKVEEVPIPDYNVDTQYVVRSMPFKVDGVWKYMWSIVDMTEEEINQRQTFLAQLEQERQSRYAQGNPAS
jgi:hypothetical protein